MPQVQWTTRGQLEFLQSHIASFQKHHIDKTRDEFFTPLFQEWFTKWPINKRPADGPLEKLLRKQENDRIKTELKHAGTGLQVSIWRIVQMTCKAECGAARWGHGTWQIQQWGEQECGRWWEESGWRSTGGRKWKWWRWREWWGHRE